MEAICSSETSGYFRTAARYNSLQSDSVDGGDMFLRNVGIFPNRKALQLFLVRPCRRRRYVPPKRRDLSEPQRVTTPYSHGRDDTSGFHKKWGISGLAEQLAVYHERLHAISDYLKNTVFRFVTPCSSKTARRFGGTYRLHLQGRRANKQQISRGRRQTELVTAVRTWNPTQLRFVDLFVRIPGYRIYQVQHERFSSSPCKQRPEGWAGEQRRLHKALSPVCKYNAKVETSQQCCQHHFKNTYEIIRLILGSYCFRKRAHTHKQHTAAVLLTCWGPMAPCYITALFSQAL
jgi:hypothetical protein